MQGFLSVLVAFIPAYLVTYIMDHDCHIWQRDACGRKGICWDYDTNSMSKSMTIFGMVVTGNLRLNVHPLEIHFSIKTTKFLCYVSLAFATACYFFSWYGYQPPRTVKTNRLLSATSAGQDDADDGKETKL